MQKSALKVAPASRARIEIVEDLSAADLCALCDAAEEAIAAGGGFGWIKAPERSSMERYWRGVLAVPERHLLIARIDGIICSAVQLVEPNRQNEAQAFSAMLLAFFTAPWARRRGAGRKLLETAELLAIEMNYKVLQLDVRHTQAIAIHTFESMGYKHWGSNPAYAAVNNRIIAGHYYMKTISPLFVLQKV